MVDEQFSDPRLAALYDLFCPWDEREDFAFYLPLVMSARSVLDVGCGTGALLRRARQDGHTGRLLGLDPAAGMLEVAQAHRDIEWVLGDLDTVAGWDQEFDLVVMTGHAFQALVRDEELRVALRTIATALTDEGRFVFETRNPSAREWENWDVRYSRKVVDATGAVVECTCRVKRPVHGDVVSFTNTYTSPSWNGPRQSSSTLRFLGPEALSAFLSEAGLMVCEQFGDWDRSPLTASSPEIITAARRNG
ncbi:ubiquinone/menaquinone biosynthesis C-methylase UbiE [Thermocatellispora tengchongensis]|uniref:Ubiquinone/menaquinone biosynthesis C-methylase UbiE n=1 Tax=Thermocatellispora tengchongensis TaxID=1073253 RepID=A0A840PDQ3_9ACTN|nr:class I SAM-dependent methyltransferase [Thermocatellispora tengchongensis]MBB5134175.1 ubiquinone/menaquinone biosynthesis C-methylase UbiE [Thermocatellispora tengchongensis]